MTDAYGEFEATTLFCPRCRKAVAVRKRLLLVLPTGNKYDYLCQACGAEVGGKLDRDPTDFRATSRAAAAAGRGAPAPGTGPPALRRRVPPGQPR
jgi:hypothetical protein